MPKPDIKCSGQMVLGLIIICGFFGALFHLMNHPVAGREPRRLVNIVLGVLTGTGFGSVVGFYFGSSVSSRGKDETISALAEPSASPPPAEPPTPVTPPTVPDAPKPA